MESVSEIGYKDRAHQRTVRKPAVQEDHSRRRDRSSTKVTMKSLPNRNVLLLASCLLAVLAFLPTGGAELTWDDKVVQYEQMRYFTSVKSAFFPPQGIPQFSSYYYRPVVVLSYMADRALGAASGGTGEADARSTAVNHLSNLVFHALATGALFLLACGVFSSLPDSTTAAFLSATFFALHPIHAESVCNIAGRSDVLAALFAFSGVALFLRYWDGKGSGSAWAAAVALLLAFLSKESALMVWGVLPVAALCRRPPSGRLESGLLRRWGVTGGLLFAVTAAYFALRGAASIRLETEAATAGAGGVQDAVAALGYYVRKVVVPWPQNHFQRSFPSLWSSGVVIAGAIVAAALLGRRVAARRKELALGLSVFVLFLVPALLVAWNGAAATPLAERYLYLPSAGVALVFGALSGSVQGGSRKKLVLFVLVAVLSVYGASAFGRSLVWMDDVALWNDAAEKPGSAEDAAVFLNLGAAYFARGDYNAAMKAYTKGLTPGFTGTKKQLAWIDHNIGVLYFLQANQLAAEGNLEKVMYFLDASLSKVRDSAPELAGEYVYHQNLAAMLLLKATARAQIQPFDPANADLLRAAHASIEESLRLHPQNPKAAALLVEGRRVQSWVEERGRRAAAPDANP
ncbi:MAG: hypothetical protein HY900_10890 [Deltaproteobacteria bacterium]|nr:hypothetical protein [Deltaproteobacteria bacterium]